MGIWSSDLSHRVSRHLQVIDRDVPMNSAFAWMRELSESLDVGMHIYVARLADLKVTSR